MNRTQAHQSLRIPIRSPNALQMPRGQKQRPRPRALLDGGRDDRHHRGVRGAAVSGGAGPPLHLRAPGDHAYGGFKAKVSLPGVTREKFRLDTFVEWQRARARDAAKFALGESHAPGEAGLARLLPKNHGSLDHRPSWRLAGWSEIRV